MQPFVSIIILNHNGRKWLKECLDSLDASTYSRDCYEVIIGDNASTDDSVVYLEANYPWVRIVRHAENYGFCKGNNLCVPEAKGKYLVFLNNDTFVTASWLENLVAVVEDNTDIAVVGGKILFPHLGKGKLINAAGGKLQPTGCGMYEGWMEEDSPEWSHGVDTGFACAAGVLVRTDFFVGTGGFDEYFFYSGEEMDLGYRAWSMGYRVYYEPRAVMYHYMGGTGFRGKGVTPTIEYLITRGQLYFILKNFEFQFLLQGLVLLEIKVTLKIAYALSRRRCNIIGKIIEAHRDIIRDLSVICDRRRVFQKSRKIGNSYLRRRGLLEGAAQMFYRNRRVSQRMHLLSGGASYYDDQDQFQVKRNQQGELVFEKG